MPLTIPIPSSDSNASASAQTTEIPVVTAAELATESTSDLARAKGTRTGTIPGGAWLPTELLDRLVAEEVAPLTLFRAPTGYGKTAVISEWIAESGLTESEPRQVHWFSCGAGSSPRFLTELAESVADAFGVDAVRASEPVAALIRQIAAVDKPLTLVIDDYHHVTNAENDLDLVALCQASPGLSLIVAGRRMQVLDGPLSRSRLHVRVIGPADLSHGTAAVHELAAHFGVPDDERLRSALEYAAGWPLAVRAALDSSEGNDPLTNLNRFALHHLEMLSRVERRALLSASQLDAITLDQIAEECEVEISEVRPAVHRLLELGLLCRTLDVDSTDFRCHSSVQSFLVARAKRSSTADQREALYRGRAERIRQTAPFTAFRLYCAAEAYEDAERLLARHFSMIVDEAQETGRIVRGLPEAVLVAHPTLMAARLMLTMPDLSVPSSSITRLVEVWQHSLAGKTASGSIADAVPAEMQLPYLAQRMVAARLSGDIEAATSLLLDFEAQLGVAERAEDTIEVTGQRSATEAPAQMLQGILPSYYRELATTALAGGDFVKARRYWQKLRRLAESITDAPDRALSRASMRTITDRISARRWLRLALYELAFTELHDGDVRSCAELITLADGVSADEATRPPGLSWVGGEVARAHLAYELDNDALLLRASEQLTPLSDRIEQWPLLLIAESESTRLRHGTGRALAQLETTMAKTDEARRTSRSWRAGLNGYRALLYSVLGNLVVAERLLDELNSEAPEIQVERARLALFAGDDVQALLLSQSMEDASTTKRSRLARTLITAVAAWNCDKRQEALLAMSRAAPLLRECYRPSSLWNVPYDALRAVAVAARDEGICDVVEMVDAVPESARAARYARLTDMEQRTLQSIAEHRNANDVAQALFVTPGTVKKHLASVYRKLAVNGRDEAILRAARMGLIAVGGTSKS